MIIWNSLKLFPNIHGYLFIFANTEIYLIQYVFFIKGFTVKKHEKRKRQSKNPKVECCKNKGREMIFSD